MGAEHVRGTGPLAVGPHSSSTYAHSSHDPGREVSSYSRHSSQPNPVHRAKNSPSSAADARQGNPRPTTTQPRSRPIAVASRSRPWDRLVGPGHQRLLLTRRIAAVWCCLVDPDRIRVSPMTVHRIGRQGVCAACLVLGALFTAACTGGTSGSAGGGASTASGAGAGAGVSSSPTSSSGDESGTSAAASGSATTGETGTASADTGGNNGAGQGGTAGQGSGSTSTGGAGTGAGTGSGANSGSGTGSSGPGTNGEAGGANGGSGAVPNGVNAGSGGQATQDNDPDLLDLGLVVGGLAVSAAAGGVLLGRRRSA